jgi:hypothetical protein
MAVKYVNSVTGLDVNAGTAVAPYETLDKAISVVAANDTIILAATATDYSTSVKTLPAGLTIKSETIPNMVKQVYARINFAASAITWTLQGNITFENLVFYNWSGATDSSFIYHGRIAGIDQIMQFTNCVIDTVQTGSATGTRGGFIGGGTTLSGIAQNSVTTNFDRCLVTNIKNRYASGIPAFLVFTPSNAWSVNIRESTFYNDATGYKLWGIVGFYGTVGVVTYRNTILKSDHADQPLMGSYYGANSPAASIASYCCLDGIDQRSATITNSINADPLFLDKSAKDFRLRASSPAIDTGVLV